MASVKQNIIHPFCREMVDVKIRHLLFYLFIFFPDAVISEVFALLYLLHYWLLSSAS